MASKFPESLPKGVKAHCQHFAITNEFNGDDCGI